jgi:hypothetical protein
MDSSFEEKLIHNEVLLQLAKRRNRLFENYLKIKQTFFL